MQPEDQTETADLGEDAEVQRLTGGAPPPPTTQRPAASRRPFGGGATKLNRGKPGLVGRNAAAVPRRVGHATFALPTEQEQRMRQRIDEARQMLGRLITLADQTQSDVSARIAEIRNYDGGPAMASAMGFDLEAADTFLRRLDALADEFVPKAS